MRKVFNDYSDLIGIPYDRMDCWELAVAFYKKVFNLELKYYYETTPKDKYVMQSLIVTNKEDFDKVRSPKFGDLITIKIKNIESHVAIYVGNGLMLHTSKTSGSVIDRVGRWNSMITGYYTLKGIADDST